MACASPLQAITAMIQAESALSGQTHAPLLRPTVSTEIYWIMPGPRGFTEALSAAAAAFRIVTLRVPAIPIAGLATAIEAALNRVHIEHRHVRWLKINDGVSLPTEIGTALARGPLPAETFAVARSPIRAIVLDAQSNAAVLACENYIAAAMEALGNARRESDQPSILAILPEASDSPHIPTAGGPQEIVFSGALNPQEMAAYVAVRMTERSGPGSTGLLRMLVAEFAGFDAKLAEELIASSDENILALPRSLESIAARADQRWRSGRWGAGCFAEIGGTHVRHTLHEVHLSQHSGPEQQDASDWLKRRYWRACVRTLLPWLEERRAAVIQALRVPLEQHVKATGGKLVRATPSGYRIETAIDDVEYNQIPGLINNERFVVPKDPKMALAVNVCYAAKRVRDDMAHMRAPTAKDILAVVETMDRFSQW